MKVIKKINNNVALCLDSNNRELMAIGTGIGFPKVPYELTDLKKIERTFYGVNSRYLQLIHEIPEDIIRLTANLLDYASLLVQYELPANLVFTLADHIHFALERHHKRMPVKLSIYHDIQHLNKLEVKIGEYGLRLIEKKLAVRLPYDEALGIALHLINSYSIQSEENLKEYHMIEEISRMIEFDFNRKINRKSTSFARFISHMQYFLRRESKEPATSIVNSKILESVVQEYPKSYETAEKIIAYISNEYGWQPDSEELLYIMLHINRLCLREDCYQ